MVWKHLLGLLLILVAAPALGQPLRAPDLVLSGTITRADHESYRELPFDVPAGVTSIGVEFDHGGREQRTTIDLGLRGPEGFRGWSGGNKKSFVVALSHATPSYLAGPLTPGRWYLVLGVPNIREGVRSPYQAQIHFGRPGDPPLNFTEVPLDKEERWFRGDFHSHTAHSDGSCANPQGARVPCPLVRTVEIAAARGLDFIAITEHNTTSHHGPMRELQPSYPRLLLLPGREITTFRGHANLFGTTADVDFQLGSARAPDFAAILGQIEAAGGILSINHPAAPSGEACMGCGWVVEDTDWRRVTAIEVANGGSMRAMGGAIESPISGIPFWHRRLNEGYRITAIGGSDNHDALTAAGAPSSIGVPTTVVYARELTVPALLEGVRSGRVFIDLEGQSDRALDFSATAGGTTAQMGGVLVVPSRRRIDFKLDVRGVEDGAVELAGGEGALPPIADPRVSGKRQSIRFSFRSDGRRQWIRVNVRDSAGKLILIGNPIYLNYR